ncbi:DUF4867 family protein [Enterococcus canintestini]|uniref:DUF4867 domain-containing protein n=1 Tax=Enterococcus canintestini TaxID=317010 RepID=A0A267HUQ5_9ENTE|nr:DUF4867 family protein [Enterococcus canintestini]PAB01243.1 hypothetical protein AKL21_04350 [Enterococcus canintestini]
MKTTQDPSFKTYGRTITEHDFSNMVITMEEKKLIATPKEGNQYLASVPAIEALPEFDWVQKNIFAGLPIQFGSGAGHNKAITAIEFHQGSEVIVALTDAILVVGHRYDIVDNTYDATLMESFLLEKGTAIELFSTTLHYSPIETNEDGYQQAIALIKGTNTPLTTEVDNPLVKVTNKFMLVHPSRTDKIAAGFQVGLIDKRIE